MKTIWKEIVDMANKSNRNILIIDGDDELGKKECDKLNIPSNSVLYSVVSNSSGIVIDNWIRFWGQSSTDNKGIYHYNSKFIDHISGLILIASDVVGGLFAININRFDELDNLVWYFAPDTLEWECMDMQYNEFLAWTMQGNVDEFYSSMRWSGWKEDLKNVGINDALFIYPFLWAKECDIEKATKRIIDFEEIVGINFEFNDNNL